MAAMKEASDSNSAPASLEMARTNSPQSHSLDINSMPSSTTAHAPENHPQDDEDPNIMDWDGPNDPEHPQNWPDARKWLNVAILSLLSVVTSAFPHQAMHTIILD